MDHLLLIYDDLSPAERAEADAYLATHPDARETVEEGRRLRALARRGRAEGTAVTDAELTYLLTAPAGRPLPSHLVALAERVEAARRSDPEVAARYEEIAHRIGELEAAVTPARAHFEALTGRSLTPPAAARPDRPAVAPARHRQRESIRWSPLRLAVAALTMLAVLYGSLFVASETARTEGERLAALGQIPDQYAVVHLRGEETQRDQITASYAEALEALRTARSTTLGLFPRYDTGDLDLALERLDAVVEADAPAGPFGLEARFLRARILLHRGSLDAARGELRIVVEREGPSAPDAARLLDAMAQRRLHG